eukprot:SM000085S23236  [mRNA]  locus=s85:194508:195492:- [translate_table: standard]
MAPSQRSGVKATTSGGGGGGSGGADPRQPQRAAKYTPPVVKPEDQPLDVASMVAIIMGILGVMLRQRHATWLSIVFCAQALANMRNAEQDLKQIVCAFTFAVMGIVTNYFGPQIKATQGSA